MADDRVNGCRIMGEVFQRGIEKYLKKWCFCRSIDLSFSFRILKM